MKEYFDAQRDAEAQFGPNAAVMMEIGSFMECYATETFGKAKRVAAALNMTVTRKNKKFPVSDSNPYMVGFPNTSHEKNVPVLLSAGLTIVWHTQCVGSNVIDRKRTRVLTQGTYAPLSEEGYHVCCVSPGAVVAMDTSVGKVSLYSGDDLRWFRDTYNPVETLLLNCSDETRDLFKASAQKFDNGNNYHDKVTRQAVIARAYADATDIPEAFLVPLAKLLDFVWSCHPKALEHLEHPLMVRQDRMSLHNNLIPQLELTKTIRGPGLISKLNQYAKTSMGRRALKRRLLCPFTEPEDIQKELDHVSGWIRKDFTEEQRVLERVPDMERALNQLFVSPTMANLCDFHEGLFHCLDLFENKDLRQAFEKVLDTQKQTFRKGYDEYLQELTQTKAEILDVLENIVLKYDYFKNCKLENYQLVTTKKRGESIAKNYPAKITLRVVNSSTVAVCTEKSETLLRDYEHVVQELSTRNTELLQRWVKEISDKFVPDLRKIISQVTSLDSVLARALCAKENNLVCPEIVSGSDHSHVRASHLRHPLIEGYIGNDCDLGNEVPGVLLYGVNGSGKTCHAKSIAMNVILAQAGFYVHAERFELSPFTKIFARINCDDDLYSGLSSFSVEMTELRSILRLADARSLIIGDELCKGTEDLSAVSLVAACVRHFHDHNVKFVFATHLHKLPELAIIKEARVAIKHVQCEHRNGEIIFKRKLADGPGDSMYGIEVARHLLGLPSIANHAMMIRNELVGRATGKIKKSNYNKKVIQDQCHACQSTKDLHTHHIEFQKNFKKEERKKMNRKDNLMVLCHTCHDKVHRGELVIEALDTLGGIKHSVKS
jgi:DNA mismatch repair protein MutS